MHPAVVTEEFLFEDAPYPSCHASTIAEAPGHGMVAAWFGGRCEGHSNVGIWVSRQEQGRWLEAVEVANGLQTGRRPYPTWNPVLFDVKGKALLLFYKVGPSPQAWWGMVRGSTDGGKTWSVARRLPTGILGPIKNKPLQLADGTLLSPSSTESEMWPGEWQVHFERSSDGGDTWKATVPVNDGIQIAAIQPSLLVHRGGKVQALGRTLQSKIFSTWSEDEGRTWTPLVLLDLPNPNAATDALTLADGRHLLVYNDTPDLRTPLSVAISVDGCSWHNVLHLETDPGEYSYPAVIQVADGRIHITYTWRRERIKHVVLDPTRL
jgi:predicted neuraminidase